MKLVFFRHGIAEEKKLSHTDMDDYRRKLVPQGMTETHHMAKSLKFIFKKINRVYASPLVRAVQTAEIISREYPALEFELMPSLDKLLNPAVFVKELSTLDQNLNYCFVGHEPHFTQSIQQILTHSMNATVKLDKSGVAVLEGASLSELKVSFLISPKMLSKINS